MSDAFNVLTECEGIQMFECPGCKCNHFFQTDQSKKPCWTWNNDSTFPTVTPSILVKTADKKGKEKICHFFIKSGWLEFLSDCTHKLAGQTVRMTITD